MSARSDGGSPGGAIDWNRGPIPVVVQDVFTGRVLMLAYMDREAFGRTLETGYMHYHSRERDRLWKKGESSGNTQKVYTLHVDCDGDAILARVEQKGGACHSGERSCFEGSETLEEELYRIFDERKEHPDERSHVSRLQGDGNLRVKKVGEEATELAMALSRGERDAAVSEAADLYFHMLVALHAAGIPHADVRRELLRRRRVA